MKVIDLLNKIANGEELPKKVIYNDFKYKFIGEDYYDKENDELLFRDSVFDVEGASLNDEVEIIEEKKIPDKLKKYHFHNRQRQLANKINEIIDCLKSEYKEVNEDEERNN